jgi:hypothetical protein
MRINKLSAPMISALRFFAGEADHAGKYGVGNATIRALVTRGLATENGSKVSLTEEGTALASTFAGLESAEPGNYGSAAPAPVAPPHTFRAPIVAASAAKFPEEFGLRGFPGDTFRISVWGSYRGDNGAAVLYTERRREDGSFADFAKGSESELLRQIVTLEPPAAPPPAPVARPAILVVLEAVKASNAKQATCTYTTLCADTSLAFEEVRATVDALSRNRLLEVKHSAERGLSIVAF